MRYRTTNPEDTSALTALWLNCFEEKREAAESFFKRNINTYHGYAAENDGSIVAALYLLDAVLDGERAHYLCGAATRRDCRNRGVMTALIRFALDDARARGDVYSLLLPADEGLYRFYARLGYEATCTAFSREFTCGEARQTPRGEADTDRLQRVRMRNKFLFWNNNQIRFAEEYYGCYGVKSLESEGAFALYEQDGCEAEVFYAVFNDIEELKRLLSARGVRRFNLTGGGADPLFTGQPPLRCGMIKPLTDKKAPKGIYIGLTLS